MAEEETKAPAGKVPKPIAGVSIADYIDMSSGEREDFHKRHFRAAARFERAMLKEEEREGHGMATLLVVGMLAGGAFLLWRAAKLEGRPIFTGTHPLDFFKQGPVLAGVVGGGVGAAASLLMGKSAANGAMLGMGIGVLGSALNPPSDRRAALPAAAAVTTSPAATRGHFVGALPTPAQIFAAQLALGHIGYDVPLDGKLSAQLSEALKKFQATYSLLTTDGTLTPETMAYIATVAKQAASQPFTPETGYHPQFTTWT